MEVIPWGSTAREGEEESPEKMRLHGGGDIQRVRLGFRHGGLREKEKELPEPDPGKRVICA